MKEIEVIASTPEIGAAVVAALKKAGIQATTETAPPQTATEAVQTDREATYECDKAAIGTSAYEGRAYFWAYEYRHYLRDATRAQRIAVHAALLAARLPLDGESQRHLEIIESITGKKS
jgi:hypothetical protein